MSRIPIAEPITAEQFLRLPESKGEELVDGRIVFVMRGVVNSYLGGHLGYLIRSKPEFEDPNWVFGAGCGIRIDDLTVRNPSLMVVRRAALPRLNDRFLEIVPNLLVEITSAVTTPDDIEQKLAEYCDLGVPLIWAIFPMSRTAHVLGANRPRVELGPDGVLDGGDVLPGFKLSLSDLFEAAEAVR